MEDLEGKSKTDNNRTVRIFKGTGQSSEELVVVEVIDLLSVQAHDLLLVGQLGYGGGSLNNDLEVIQHLYNTSAKSIGLN